MMERNVASMHDVLAPFLTSEADQKEFDCEWLTAEESLSRSHRNSALPAFECLTPASQKSPREPLSLLRSTTLNAQQFIGSSGDRNKTISMKVAAVNPVRHQLGIRSIRNHEILRSSKNKKNQDTVLVTTLPHEGEDVHVFGVMDGHGPLGEKVSHVVSKKLVERLRAHFKLGTETIATSIQFAFAEVDEYLDNRMAHIVRRSGSTCTMAIQKGCTIFVANVGDSRCSVGEKRALCHPSSLLFPSPKQGSKPLISITRLTDDHKPDNERERKRIISHGGTVDQISTGIGTYTTRLGNPNEKKRRATLSVTRSFGDLGFKEVGVNAVPDLNIIDLHERHCFLLLASDGVWEVMDEDQVVAIIREMQGESAQAVSDAITETADRKWRCTDSGTDDISVIFSWLTVETEGSTKPETSFTNSLATSFRRVRSSKSTPAESFSKLVRGMKKLPSENRRS